jgi:hypothetical protein
MARDLKIYIPDAVDATRTVEITYRVRNGTRFFDSYDEFYWNVTGNDWPVPIDHATATVRFPLAASGSLRAQAFTGVYGSSAARCRRKSTGPEAVFETNNPLPMRGGLTIDVYIPKDILKEPSALTKFFWFVGGNPIVFLPLVTLVAAMFSLWWLKGRDPDPGVSVAPMYAPPAGISPAEAGTLLNDSIHPRDITSTIIDLAVRGYIKIEETAEKALVFTHKDYIFHLLKPREQWGSDLAPHERVMLENVFALGPDTRLSSLKNRFYTSVPVIRQDIMAALKTKGIYLLDPESANGYSVGMADRDRRSVWHFAVPGLGELFQLRALAGGVRATISVDLVAVCARHDSQDGQGSAGSRIEVLGFQEFMNRVDAERLKVMPPTTFEKFLPYAMASGRGAPLGAGVCRDRERSAAAGTLHRGATRRAWCSIRFSFPVPCTAWQRICIRYLSLLHARVLAGRVLVAADSAVVAGSRVGVSAAEAGARFRLEYDEVRWLPNSLLALTAVRSARSTERDSSTSLNRTHHVGDGSGPRDQQDRER